MASISEGTGSRLDSRSGILVVDDSLVDLKLLSSVLAQEGYLVRPASGGLQALDCARRDPPELVLLDLQMPDLDGLEVCRMLRADERLRTVPVLFLSGVDDPAERVRGFRAGALDFIGKPFRKEELLARVRTHLELGRLRLRLEGAVRERTAHLATTRRRLEEELAERESAETALSEAEAEQERLQAQLRKAQRLEAIGKLAGGVAHDFNNMLTVILCQAELGQMAVSTDSVPGRCFEEILFAARRSSDLTRQLLTFARSQQVDPVVLDLNDAVGRTLGLLRRLLGEGVEVIWLPNPDAGRVRIDPSQVDQILANLCINARDAMDGDGVLTIATERVRLEDEDSSGFPDAGPGEYVVLSVSDTGCGMTPEVHENLFEPFFTTKEPGKGTGLGLATVFGAVRQSGGFIDVASEPGQGATFRVHLPVCHDCPDRRASDTAALAREPAAGTILLVEDSIAVMAVARLALERKKYRTLAVSDPFDALRIAREHEGTIDLLLTDVVMPGMNGRELARRIRETRPEMRVLFMTGYSRDVLGGGDPLEPGMSVMPKPFTSESLLGKVARALRGS